MKKIIIFAIAIIVGILVGTLLTRTIFGNEDNDWKTVLYNTNGDTFKNVTEVHFNNETSTEEASIDFKGIDAEYFYTGSTLNITGIEAFPADMSKTFQGMENLRTVDFGDVSTANVTNIDKMFAGAVKLESVDLNTFTNIVGNSTTRSLEPSKVFQGCKNLEKVYIDLAIGVDAFKGLDNLDEFSVYNPTTGNLVGLHGSYTPNRLDVAQPIVIVNNNQVIDVNVIGNTKEVATIQGFVAKAVKGFEYKFNLEFKEEFTTGGYETSVKVNDTVYTSENGVYTVANIDRDVTVIEIEAAAVAKIYNVTVGGSTNATVVGAETATYGSEYNFTVEVNEGHELVKVEIDGNPVVNREGNFTIDFVTGDVAIKVFTKAVEETKPTTPTTPEPSLPESGNGNAGGSGLLPTPTPDVDAVVNSNNNAVMLTVIAAIIALAIGAGSVVYRSKKTTAAVK